MIASLRMRIVYATLCAAAVALPAPAHASVWNVEPAAGPTAEQLYEDGRKDYRLGRFQQAIDKWEAAYAQAELPLLLYNIALAYRQLYDVTNKADDLRKGKVVLRNFLVIAERDPDVDPADAQKLADEIDVLLEQAEDGSDTVVPSPTDPVDDKPVDPNPTPTGPDPGRTRRIIGGALMGGGGAILLTGVILGIVYGQQGLKWRDALDQAKQDDQDARNLFTEMGLGDPDTNSDEYDTFSEGRCTLSDGVTPADEPCSVVIKTFRENGRGSNLATALSLGIGGGLGLGAIVAGAVVFVQGNKRTKEWKQGGTTARETIRIAPRGLGLTVSGRF